MRLHVRDDGSSNWKVVYSDTGETVRDVIWADDEAGEFERYYRDGNGEFVVRYDQVMTEFKQNQSIRFLPKVIDA